MIQPFQKKSRYVIVIGRRRIDTYAKPLLLRDIQFGAY